MRSKSWRLRLAVSGFMFAAAICHAAPAVGNSGCQPSVTVRTLPLNYTEVDTGDVRAVTALNRNSSLPLTQNSFGLGSTYAESHVMVSWKKDAQGCPALDLQVSYHKTTVHVASELRENACAFDHVHAHEMNHLAIYRRWLDESPQRLGEFFKQRFESLAAMDSLSRNQETIRLALAEFGKVRAQHDEFDSAAEYDHNQAVCDRFIPKMLDRLKAEGKLP
ncbi:hypothetical protein [uncultured Azohydromonas sp.]|jgi:hypothetical protein|uniref:hypothetical protein n=1 Tax=uncultured Azohydromonas sp. TaxID=487342 RepID=UPI0026230225|nr:hypothetical protein [uncultured Azohydromonas sp.]